MRPQISDHQLLAVVREQARRQGLRIQDLANRLRVSEPTIKRWLRGKGVSLHAWTSLLSAVGLSIEEAAERAGSLSLHQVEYTEKQELALSKVPGLLAFYQQLLEGKTPKEIMRKHGLKASSTAKYLRRLDEIGLVRWREAWNCKVLSQGEPRWRKGGPLAKCFRERVYQELVHANQGSERLKLGLYTLAPGDVEMIEQGMTALLKTAWECERKAKQLKVGGREIGISLLLADYSPAFLREISDTKGKV